jgi:hypothetical protein
MLPWNNTMTAPLFGRTGFEKQHAAWQAQLDRQRQAFQERMAAINRLPPEQALPLLEQMIHDNEQNIQEMDRQQLINSIDELTNAVQDLRGPPHL